MSKTIKKQILILIAAVMFVTVFWSAGVSAADIKPSADEIILKDTDSTVKFDVILEADKDFAGAEFGIRVSSDDVVFTDLSWNEDVKDEQHVQTSKAGTQYFGFFASNNKYNAGTYNVASVSYSYSGDTEQKITLDSSKLVMIKEDGSTSSDTSSKSFEVIIKRTTSSKVDTGATASEIENAILAANDDSDLSYSKFAPLKAKASKAKSKSIKVSWSAPKNAVKYNVYTSKCGTAYKKYGTVKNHSLTQTALKKGTYYKYLIVAVDKNDKVVSISKTIHAATTGGKVTNPKQITIKKYSRAKKSLSKLSAGKGYTLKVEVKKVSSKKKLKKHRGIRYESSDTQIATVGSNGRVTGISKGTCTIYIYAQNGVSKAIKVTVK